MIADPLNRLKRPPPASPGPNTGETADPPEHPVAPAWVGNCLRLAGDAFAPSLVLRQREGKLTALGYAYLTAVRFDPTAALELDFSGYAVSVTGRRLQAVFESLASQRVLELAESPSNVDEKTDAPFIETISIVSTQER